MRNSDLKGPANPVVLTIGSLLVLLAIAACAMGLYSLFASETPPFSGLEKLAERGNDDYFGGEVMAANLFNHYMSILLKPLLMVGIGLVILLLGIILCGLARPHIIIKRPIHIQKNLANAKPGSDSKIQVVQTEKIGSWIKAFNLTPVQWILAILVVVFAINYSPGLAGISFGALVVILWQKYASEGVTIETIGSDEEQVLADEGENEAADPKVD